MAAHPTLNDHLRNEILALRQRIRFEDGRPYDARCSRVAAALQAQFGWKRVWGRLRLLDSHVCWQHCWNLLPDGHMLDATADQFEARWLGDLVVLGASDPHAAAYQATPAGWTFTPQEREAGIDLIAAQDGAEQQEAVLPCANWLVVAHQVLMLMTGWSLPADLVDYTAHILRVRALLRQPLTSGDLDGLLTVYEGAYAAAARGGPWMSAEYVAVLSDNAQMARSKQRTNALPDDRKRPG